jgi:DNA-binding YbaB/EbfC family protein
MNMNDIKKIIKDYNFTITCDGLFGVLRVKNTELLELSNKTYDATSGGGAVSVTVTGERQVKEIKLQPEIVDPDDIEMLQDLIMAATNEAIRQMDEISSNEMSKFTGSLGLPPGLL